MSDLATLVRDLISPSKQVNIRSKKTENIFRNRYVPDISRAKNELGLIPTISLEDSIIDSMAHYAK
jgi:dTDP-glucose 4,6-dehydratase